MIGPSGNEAASELQAEQQRVLAEQLDEAKRNAAAQIDEAKRSAAAQINALQMQLTSEQAKSTRLGGDLAGARAQLVQADRQKTAGAAAMKEMEKRAQVLAEQQEEAKRTAAAQIGALQTRLDSEQAKTTGLDGDLVRVREQLAKADQERAAGGAATKDDETDLQTRQKALSEQLDEAKRTAAAQISALKTRLNDEQAKTASLDGDLGRAREQIAQADRDKAAEAASTRDSGTAQRVFGEQLEDARRTAATTLSALRVQLDDERAKTASLDGDLGRAREQLAQADRDKATEAASAKDSHANQQALTEQLESAKRTAAAQISDLQAQLDGQKAKTTNLDGELARIREQVAQAERDKAAEAAATAELQKQQAIAERQDEEKRIAAAQISALQSQLDNAQAKSTGLDDDLARLREQIAVADREKAAGAVATRDNEELAKQQQALSEQLDEAERSAAAQIGALQTQLSSEQAKPTNLDGDPARADREKGAATKGQETEQRSLAKQLEDSKQAAATEIASLQTRLNSEQAKSTSLDGDLSRLREQVTHADREKVATTAALKVAATQQQQALTTQLEDARRAAANQMSALQMQLNTVQAKATSLAGDLAREQLAKADQQKTAWAAAAKDYDAKLQQQRQALLQQLDEAKRSAAAQTSALRLQLNDAQAKTTSLAGDLARAQSAQADRDTAARMAAAKDYDAKLQKQQQSLAVELDEAKRTAEAQIATLRMKINNEQAKSTRADASGARAQPGRPDQDGTASSAPVQGSEPGAQTGPAGPERRVTTATREALPVTEGSGSAGLSDQNTETSSTKLAPTAGQVSLPDGVPARIVLRYSRDSEAARARAMSLRQILRAQGLDVADPVGTPARIPTNSVTYFYLEDRSNAKVVADVLATSGPIRGRPPANEPAPRPGTIDVSIAG